MLAKFYFRLFVCTYIHRIMISRQKNGFIQEKFLLPPGIVIRSLTTFSWICFSAKMKIFSKIFWGVTLGHMCYRLMKKTRHQKSHFSFLLITVLLFKLDTFPVPVTFAYYSLFIITLWSQVPAYMNMYSIGVVYLYNYLALAKY